MRRFDIQAAKILDQYWSSLDYSTTVIDGQVDSDISGITFLNDHVVNNRPISRHSSYSIELNSDPGIVEVDIIEDFNITLLMQANTSTLWIIKFMMGTDEIGVKINQDTSLNLIWPHDDIVFDDDGNYELSRIIQTESLLYSEDVGFLSLSRKNGVVTMIWNGKVVSIDGPSDLLTNFELGGGSGTALVDKIGFSLVGQGLSVNDYALLFKSQRLDTVPRPSGEATFNYLLDAYEPDSFILDRTSFSAVDDYQYSVVVNSQISGNWDILKRADFNVEYSIDDAVTWESLGTRTKLIDDISSVIFRHQQDTNNDYWIEVRITHDVNIPMSFFNAVIDGDVFLPGEIGFGYFDADPGDFTLSSITLTNNESGVIRSIEFLGLINNDSTIFSFDGTDVNEGITEGYTLYINGDVRTFASVKQNQMYHFVIVLDEDADEVVLNPDKSLSLEIVGLGASSLEYSQADAYYIYNTFVGNPLIAALELDHPFIDGELDGGPPGAVLDLQWNK